MQAANETMKLNVLELWNCERKIYILQPLTSRFITFVRILIYLFVIFLFKGIFQANEVLSYSIYCMYIHVVYRRRNLYYIVEFFRWYHFVIYMNWAISLNFIHRSYICYYYNYTICICNDCSINIIMQTEFSPMESFEMLEKISRFKLTFSWHAKMIFAKS